MCCVDCFEGELIRDGTSAPIHDPETHLVDTESEVTSLAEVSLLQLVLLNLQSTLQDLLGLGTSDGDVTGDLLVSSNREGSDGVSGLGGDGRLTGELLQHLGGSGEPVSRLSDSDVYVVGVVSTFLFRKSQQRSRTH
jgi:hypothetical protein